MHRGVLVAMVVAMVVVVLVVVTAGTRGLVVMLVLM
jgi:hypothetical protein